MEKEESENVQPIKQENVIWGGRSKKEKVSVLIGLSRSPSFKPISDMEMGEYEYWIRSNEDLSNFMTQHKLGNEEINYLDFQGFGFTVVHSDEEWCTFKKFGIDVDASGKFYFKTNHLLVNNNINDHWFNGIIPNKKFLFDIMLCLGCVTQQDMFDIGRSF